MTPISIAVPESLTKQKRELESTLSTILAEEEKLVTKKKEIEAALAIIATSVAILSGELVPTAAMKPMSDDAKSRIAEWLRKSREAKGGSIGCLCPSGCRSSADKRYGTR